MAAKIINLPNGSWEYIDEDLVILNTRLHAMYKNRQLMEFLHGKEEFYKKIREIHYDYGWPGGTDLVMMITLWEFSNQYYDKNYRDVIRKVFG